MKWMYCDPVFECDEYNKDMLKYSPWAGHRRFIYDFMVNIKPEKVVELGSFYGCSAFAMAQAVKDKSLDSSIWCVDMWEAIEDFTKSDYIEDVYSAFLRVRDHCYHGDYLKPLKMTFEAARELFDEKSIDVLHIDGSHYYEDVKRDFEQWLPVVKDDAVILFHDVGEDQINGQVMGSHVFWEELKQKYDKTLEFDFSCGLGILCLGDKYYTQLKQMELRYYQHQCNLDNTELKDEIRRYSFVIRDRDFYIADLKKQIEIKDMHLNKYAEDMSCLKAAYESDEKLLRESYQETIDKKDQYINTLRKQQDEIKAAYQKTIDGKDEYIAQLEGLQDKIQNEIKAAYQKTIDGKDQYIKELEERLNHG